MVVRFVFEHQKPVFLLTVNVYLDFYRAGINFLGFIQISELAGLFEIFRADRGHVHQRDRLFAAPQRLADGDIALVGRARVILVDLDMRKPSVKRAMGVTIPSVGVVELIERKAGKKAPEVRLLKMEGTELYLLAGDTGCRDTQQMNSRRLSVLLESLRDRADYIILDTPPCGLLADSVNVARAADCALYVTGCGVAEVPHIVESLQFLAESGTPIVGCVLNGVSGSTSRYGYGYGYVYGYGYGEKQTHGKKPAGK